MHPILRLYEDSFSGGAAGSLAGAGADDLRGARRGDH